jgi:imidazole glycerol-phosphate synthase subunit HisH
MITIVNYGLGNIQAISNIYRRLNIPVEIAESAGALGKARRIILPGVGAFDWAMCCLNKSGMRDVLDDLVLNKGVPVLGICVGMQMLGHRSDEGKMEGLHWIDGDVKRFDETACRSTTHLPHMGWNNVRPRVADMVFQGMDEQSRFYFLHSYYFAPASHENILATTDYFGEFASSVFKGNVFGVQFHPEKSHQWGIRLLKNFAEAKLC